ncbi:MAG: hypothetical protein O2928_17250, partial [Proteobacteria bacterium]|nr:hypothetical protein [Pseudomonadota bacterium]
LSIKLLKPMGVLAMSNIGKSIIQGAMEALDYVNGIQEGSIVHKIAVPQEVDVVAIRDSLHMSRKKFCDEFGFSIRTLEKWERGERLPESPARAYLTVIAQNPKAVIEALRRAT